MGKCFENSGENEKIYEIERTRVRSSPRATSLKKCFENYRSSPNLCAAFLHDSVFAPILAKSGLGYILGILHKLIWSP
jgi:hypothetical protein